MNTKIRSLKKASSCGPQRNFGYNFRRICPVYQNEFDMPGVSYILNFLHRNFLKFTSWLFVKVGSIEF